MVGHQVSCNVIDWKTREPWRPDDVEPTEQERLAAFTTVCADSIFLSAIKIRAAAGLDMALRALHQAADDIKNYGK